MVFHLISVDFVLYFFFFFRCQQYLLHDRLDKRTWTIFLTCCVNTVQTFPLHHFFFYNILTLKYPFQVGLQRISTTFLKKLYERGPKGVAYFIYSDAFGFQKVPFNKCKIFSMIIDCLLLPTSIID